MGIVCISFGCCNKWLPPQAASNNIHWFSYISVSQKTRINFTLGQNQHVSWATLFCRLSGRICLLAFSSTSLYSLVHGACTLSSKPATEHLYFSGDNASVGNVSLLLLWAHLWSCLGPSWRIQNNLPISGSLTKSHLPTFSCYIR